MRISIDGRGMAAAVVTVALAVLMVAGCSSEPEPTSPGGAYRMFRAALVDGDSKAMWERCAPRTHEYFQARYDDLVTMDRKIERYMPQTDHRLARKQAGTELLDKVDGGRALFERVVRPNRIVVNQSRKLGLSVQEIRMSKDESRAVAATYAGQEFRMVKGENGEWYVRLVESVEAVDEAFAWLRNNKTALEKTIDELVEDERSEREQVIAELFDVEY